MTTDIALTPQASASQAGAVIRVATRTLVVTGPDIQSLLSAVSVDLEIAPTMEIDSPDMAVELMEMLGRMSTVSSAIEKERLERGAPLRETLEWLAAGYNPTKVMLDAAIKAGKEKITAYNRRVAEAKRLLEEAEAQKRRDEAAAAAKVEADAVRAAEQTARDAAAARAQGSEQVANAMETQAAVAIDTARESAAVAARAVYVAPARNVPTASTKGTSQSWKAEVTDKAKLIAHIGTMVAGGDMSLMNLLDVSDKNLNAMAKLQMANMRLPGVRPIVEDKIAIRKQAVAA